MTCWIYRPNVAAVPVCLAASLLAAVPAMAQAPQVNGPRPPSRIANHYDHKAFQPNQSAVCAGDPNDRIDCAPQGNVASEVDKIQQDIAEINKKYPPGFLSQPGGH